MSPKVPESLNSDVQYLDDSFLINDETLDQVTRVFLDESKTIFANLEDQILKLESQPDDKEVINALFRKIHTLKGSVGPIPGGQLIGSMAHEFEALLSRIKAEQQPITLEIVDLFLKTASLLKALVVSLNERRPIYPEELSETIELMSRYGSFKFGSDGASENSQRLESRHADLIQNKLETQGVWLSMHQLNEILKVSGELLVLKNLLQAMNQSVDFRLQPELYERRHAEFTHNFNKISGQLQSQVQVIRKEKAQEVFKNIPILVRTSATKLDKFVEYTAHGMDCLIDKSIAQDLNDVMIHLIRNSIDHGIEDQFARALLGKSSIGKLHLEVFEKNGIIHLVFSDDGAGLNRQLILNKAINFDLVQEHEAAGLTDEEIFKFIFHPGFSTKEKITTISGRGVGMDVVENTVKKYGGKIDVLSTINKGTTFHLEIPLPQNIMFDSTLICSWSDLQFAIPLISVSRITSGSSLQITYIKKFRYCQYDGRTVPILDYREFLNNNVMGGDDKLIRSSVVFIKFNEDLVGLIVDKVIGQADLVVRNFGKILKRMRGFKGVSVLADENITYIVDPEDLLSLISSEHEQQWEAA